MNTGSEVAVQLAVDLTVTSAGLRGPSAEHRSCRRRCRQITGISRILRRVSDRCRDHTAIILPARRQLVHWSIMGCVRSGGVVVRALDLRFRWSRVRLPVSRFQAKTLGKLFTHTRASVAKQF